MRDRGERARVAILVGTGIVTVIVLALFARRPILFDRQVEYQAMFLDVAGLNAGDEVRYGGLRVGSVRALDIDSAPPSAIRVRFRVRRTTPIRTDTRATITQLGLLGQPYLELDPGDGMGKPLAAGGTLRSEELLTVQEAMRRLGGALDRADSVFAALDRLSRANPLAHVESTLTRADTFVRTATIGSERVLTRLDAATRQLGLLLARSERLVGVIDTAIAQARPGLSESQREMARTIRETHALVAELRDALEQGGGVSQLVRNLNSASENFARLSVRLERDPSSLLRGRKLPPKPAGPAIRD